MAEQPASLQTEPGQSRRFLTFRAAGQRYALPSEQVREIVRPPALARVPLSPKALLGLGNLRGAVLPVAGLAALMGADDAAPADPRVIVLDAAEPLGLLIDDVDALASANAASVDAGDFDAGGLITGMLPGVDEGQPAKILNMDAIISRAFPATQREAGTARFAPARREALIAVAGETELFISFDVGEQGFALPLASVREVITTPASITSLPQAEPALLGMIGLRGALLPLMSMRRLLDLEIAEQPGKGMTIVVAIGGVVAAFQVDAVRDILRVGREALEAAPPLINAPSQSEAKLQAVIKLQGGERLVGVLDPRQLFREDLMTRIDQSVPTETGAPEAETAERAILVFVLAGQEYGLAISSVEEVARLPDQITRLPHAPPFLKGVINLRGSVVPVIDQRVRFETSDCAAEANGARRLIVARIHGSLAAFLVDSVSEVLRVPISTLDSAPGGFDGPQVLEGVLNLADSGRMILLLDPAGLLSHAEKGLLDALGGKDEAQSAVDQSARRG